MTTHCQRLTAAALVACLPGCATARPHASALGRAVEVRPVEGRGTEAAKGELLAVGPQQLWVMEREGPRQVDTASIEQVRVKRHNWDGRRAWTWTIVGALVTSAALTAACGSVEGSGCGRVPLAVGSTWLALGGLSAVQLERSSTIRMNGPGFESLRPYARFPQGLPEGLDPKTLPPVPAARER